MPCLVSTYNVVVKFYMVVFVKFKFALFVRVLCDLSVTRGGDAAMYTVWFK